MRKSILTVAAIIMASVSAFSQSATETRRIKNTAFQLYENYKVQIQGLHSTSAYTEDNFLTLFSKDAKLYNNIISENTTEQLSPKDYFKHFRENLKRVYPVFSDFKIGDPVSAGDRWQVKCYFTQTTKFRTQTEMRYPEWTFHYTMTIEMDKYYNSNNKVYYNAEIVSIEVENPLKEFFVIENKENMPLLSKSGEIVAAWDKEYYSRIFPENEWKIGDMQVVDFNKTFAYSKSELVKNETDERYYQYKVQRFKKDIFGAGINYSPCAFWNKLRIDSVEIETKIRQAVSLSGFYGKQFFHKERSSLFANVGLDLNIYHYRFKNDAIGKDSFMDSVGDTYRRIISPKDTGVTIFSVSIPLSVQYIYQLTKPEKKPIFLLCELGVFVELAFSSKIEANVSGIYGEEYFGVKFDHYYDYGDFPANRSDSRVNGGIFGGVGALFALNKSNLLKVNLFFKAPFGQFSNSFKTKEYSLSQGVHFGIGISWIQTIGENK